MSSRFRTICTRLLGVVICLPSWSAVLVLAQPEDPPPDREGRQMMNRMEQVARQAQALGPWEDQADLISQAVESIFDQQGWESEADGFARELAQNVSKIPPWQFDRRIGRMTDMVSERYDLSNKQRARFTGIMYRESFTFVLKHANVLFRQAEEFIDARAAGKPFSASQVARWTRETEPMMKDAEQRLEALENEFSEMLSPKQREILERDFESLSKRLRGIKKMRRQWAGGRWNPEDWGLQHDPIHANAMRMSPVLRRHHPADAASNGNVEFIHESEWARYVRNFVARHNLDATQKKAAKSILNELEARAAEYRSTHAKDFEAAEGDTKALESLRKPIAEMFEELKSRLDQIPTTSQMKTNQQ